MAQRYVVFGAGQRALQMFIAPMIAEMAGHVELVGIADPNPLRAKAVKAQAGATCPIYTDVDRMLAETRPHRAVIATPDCTHHAYAIKCMEAGIEVISEKPLTTDAEKCRAMLETEQRTGQHVTVTFNLRFVPYLVAIKELLLDGVIGEIASAHLIYQIGRLHGADYFRRWHRRKANSGGLLVHKSSHHFDLLNWWLDDEPVAVAADGARRVFGPVGRRDHGERCLTCPSHHDCEFYLDLNDDPLYRSIYLDCEQADGYLRDRCVFDEEIDIEDTANVLIEYARGTRVSYVLNAYAPQEGYRGSIVGTRGQLDFCALTPEMEQGEPCFQIYIHQNTGRTIRQSVPLATGDHGGGDARLRRMLFAGDMPDRLGQMADSYAGALAASIGFAANASIREQRSIRLETLLPLAQFRPQRVLSGVSG